MHLSNFLNLQSISQVSNQSYNATKPFPHVVIDNFLKDEIAREINKIFPSDQDEIWYQYNNPIEKKFASDDIRKFPPLIAKVIHTLNSQSFLDQLSQLTGIKDLMSDPYLHGGGLHLIKTGGKLDMHLDYAIHPKLGFERRINLILYMVDPDFKDEWGGDLELWNGFYDDKKDKHVLTSLEKSLKPKFNRAVIFNTDDSSYHGHPEPLRTPEGIFRKSIALYYLTAPRDNCNSRPRARFIARPQDDQSEEIENFRKMRSTVGGIYNLTKTTK